MGDLWRARNQGRIKTVRIGIYFLLLSFVSGCNSINYYSQLAGGQWELLWQRESIDTLLAHDGLDESLKSRLKRVQTIRQFAITHLSLSDNNSYRYYTDLKRPYAVWNVFAAPEFSMRPVTWCFPFAGCVSYKGYFSQVKAQAYAEELARSGHDTYVAGVVAYSTLGWFDDPVLNTFVYKDDTDLAGLLFHELAHQQLYVLGDTSFNESFAKFVEVEAVKRWLQFTNQQQQIDKFLQRQKIHSEFVELVLAFQTKLAKLYQEDLPDKDKRYTKHLYIKDFLTRQYPSFRSRWNGYTGFDRWVNASSTPNFDIAIATPLNNAKLSTIASYHQWLPAFEQLFHDANGEFILFYQYAKKISELKHDERQQALLLLSQRIKK